MGLRSWEMIGVAALWLLAPLASQAGRKTRTPAENSPHGQYVGSQACLACHADKASALQTPMGRALARPQDADVLRARPWLAFRTGHYAYDIMTTAKGADCFLTDGKHTLSAPIVWAVGNGSTGQTYILRYGRHYLESQVSYYAETRALDITVGHPRQPPRSLEDAMGLPISEAALRHCLSCHATSAVRKGRLTLDQMMAGVGCERCHGPGAAHVAAMQAGNVASLEISNPGKLPAAKATDFCASCHRTRQEVTQFSITGVGTVRFEVYRLGRSRCYKPDDARITCTTCHDPHLRLDTVAKDYDARCLACHDGNSRHAHRCSTGTGECVTCHMPKVRVPEVNASFTDHWIRIAKPDKPYPE